MLYKTILRPIVGAVCLGFSLVVLVRHAPIVRLSENSPALVQTISFVNFPQFASLNSNITSSLNTDREQAVTNEKGIGTNVDCQPAVPCRYPEVVDLRIIILTYNRAKSLTLLLNSLDKLELDGDQARIEIWIDRSRYGQRVDNGTLKVARKFKWSKGKIRVHVQQKHVGIYGQWIDTWAPSVNSTKGLSEIALILEDDMLVSPFAYRWLKAVHKHYGQRSEYFGASLVSDNPRGQQTARPRLFSQTNVTVFYQKFTGTWGTSPSPRHWDGFQRWYHKTRSTTPKFKPYIPKSTGCILTNTYRSLERRGQEHTMWSQWVNYYVYQQKLFTIYNNLEMYNNGSRTSCLSVNRRAAGLHFLSEHENRKHYCELLTTWRPDFITFPRDTPFTDWNGSIINKY